MLTALILKLMLSCMAAESVILPINIIYLALTKDVLRSVDLNYYCILVFVGGYCDNYYYY